MRPFESLYLRWGMRRNHISINAMEYYGLIFWVHSTGHRNESWEFCSWLSLSLHLFHPFPRLFSSYNIVIKQTCEHQIICSSVFSFFFECKYWLSSWMIIMMQWRFYSSNICILSSSSRSLCICWQQFSTCPPTINWQLFSSTKY